MPRKKRIWYPGAIYHVMSRGNRKMIIFKEESDYIQFLDCLANVKKEFGFRIYSLCLMTNHFHMAVGTGETELCKIMHKLLLMYAASYNKKYKLTGHVFENRYIAQIIENEPYFLEVSRYIHLNPVKAQIVSNPLDYAYSSYRMFVPPVEDQGLSVNIHHRKAGSMISGLIDTGKVLSCFPDQSRSQYQSFVEERISHEDQEKQIQKDMKEDDMWVPCT